MERIDRLSQFLSEIGKSDESLIEMMLVLIKTLEERDAYTKGHSERVSALSVMIGQELGLDSERLLLLERGALLHDIGKIGIPDNILYKAGGFSQEERAHMDKHPEKGHLIVLNCHRLWDLIPMIRNHHENYDGSGYPDKLKGEEIPFEVRIVSLADYFDALATERPYKKAFSKEKALEFVHEMAGKKFDPKIVDGFIKVVDRYYKEYIKPLQA